MLDYQNRQFLKNDSQKSSERTCLFKEGNIVFKKGESGELMYEIRSGCVGIYLNYKEPGEVLLAKKYAGDTLGEIALIENRPRTATVVALEDHTILREISVNGFIPYVKKRPEILKPIMDAMADRFKMQRSQYFNACKAFREYYDCIESGSIPGPKLKEKISKYLSDAEKTENF